ncbi:MAG TPA: SRPBCC family protein [Pyrinomonadaceae bacterium]|jgi:ligand-binding SRPBCC domain-containing protein
MPEIRLETFISAPVERCFDLSRSIDLHKLSLEHTGEKAIDGKTSGLIEKGEFVTWQARHFGVKQKLSVEITQMKPPDYFCDEMTKGAFEIMRHEHFFEGAERGTLMIDKFYYKVPFWIFGAVFDYFVLQNYMKRLLEDRNNTIKRFAESDEWKKVLKVKE